MVRSRKTRLRLLLISILLLADLASLSFGRRAAELYSMSVGGGGGDSPPAKGYRFSRKACSSASRRRLGLGDGSKHMHLVSKRQVPQGPNPLHN
ncbi:hypothetical protein ACP70R_021048 [Stipagrostis hirtigluma subsp. patula]